MTEWLRTQVKVFRIITKKEKKLIIMTTKEKQYWNLEDFSLKFDYRKY